MGKERQEEICFENLKSKKGGKYVSKMLAAFRKGTKIDDWKESPDFIVEVDKKILAVEHFTVDSIYVNKRSANRMTDEKLWSTYNTHHEALEKGVLDESIACKDLEQDLQFALDVSRTFDYDISMEQFERIFENHVRKIPKYMENLIEYQDKEIYFLIEMSLWWFSRYRGLFDCIAIRKDGGEIRLDGSSIIITEKIVEIMKGQIGILKGIIIQGYTSLDLNKDMKSMVYLDLSSENEFEKSIAKQRIEIYKEYYLSVPKINVKFNLE